MFSILFVMDEFIRYLWLVIVRTMDFLGQRIFLVGKLSFKRIA